MSYLGNAPARSFISFERQVFTIVNSQTAYALSHSVTNENDIRLVVNNVVQEPGSGKAYTATGTALTLSAALTNGTDEMYCVFLGRATATSAPGAGSIGTAQLASDSVTLAKMAPGTDGNIISYDASGNPVAIATGNDGQVLTSAGAGAQPAFETLPVGGITEADQWRISSTIATSTHNSNVLITNWERNDNAGFSKIGTGMSLNSGIFTFPSTGIYKLDSLFYFIQTGGGIAYASMDIYTTTNNSTYLQQTSNFISVNVTGIPRNIGTNSFIFDVTDTSNCKVKWNYYVQGDSTLQGATDKNTSTINFLRLGDT